MKQQFNITHNIINQWSKPRGLKVLSMWPSMYNYFFKNFGFDFDFVHFRVSIKISKKKKGSSMTCWQIEFETTVINELIFTY